MKLSAWTSKNLCENGRSAYTGTTNCPQNSPFRSVSLCSNLLRAESFLSFRYLGLAFNLHHKASIKHVMMLFLRESACYF